MERLLKGMDPGVTAASTNKNIQPAQWHPAQLELGHSIDAPETLQNYTDRCWLACWEFIQLLAQTSKHAAVAASIAKVSNLLCSKRCR